MPSKAAILRVQVWRVYTHTHTDRLSNIILSLQKPFLTSFFAMPPPPQAQAAHVCAFLMTSAQVGLRS